MLYKHVSSTFIEQLLWYMAKVVQHLCHKKVKTICKFMLTAL